MQAKVNSKQFLNLIKNCAIDKRPTLPILSQIKLTAENGKLTIYATDLNTYTSFTIPANVEEEGIVLVNYKKLLDVLKVVKKDKEITIKTEDNNLFINNAKLKLDFDAEDNDFPLPEDFSSDLAVSISGKELLEGINKTLYAVSKDKSRFNLNGVCFSFYDNKLDFVATDGHRLALYTTEITDKKFEGKYVIPTDAIKLLKNLLSPTIDNVEFAIKKDLVFFKFDNVIIQANLDNGVFPDYRQVIPNSFNIEVKLDRYFFIDILQEFISIIELKEKPILIEIDNDQMKIINADTEECVIEKYLSLDKAYQPFKIKFNAKYLFEAIKPIISRNIIIKFVDSNTQIVIIPENLEERYMAVVMPMELKS